MAVSAESQVQSEFAQLQEQLSGVEQYAMRYLEAERAHIISQELQMAEVCLHHPPHRLERNTLTSLLSLSLFLLQRNIELAKKDWELTHLQNLRAEEERLAEEEADDVLLTYDRPETANKVILRRRPSTGTWEIFSQPPLCQGVGSSETAKRQKNRVSSCRVRQPRRGRSRRSQIGEEGDTASLDSSSSLRIGSIDESLSFNCNEQESPLPLTNHNEARSHDNAASNEQTTSFYKEREAEGNLSLCDGTGREADGSSSGTTPPRTAWTGGPIKSEPTSPFSTPRTPLSPPSTNHTPEGSISTRTRHRTSQSLSELEQSPRHKYPTRRKLQHTASVS